MGLNDATLDLAANALRSGITHVGIATGAPGTDGLSNASAAARQAVTWTTPTTGGDFQNTADLAYTGGASSGPALYATFWSALNGGTYRGFKALSGDQAFNAGGAYTIPAGQLKVTSTSAT